MAAARTIAAAEAARLVVGERHEPTTSDAMAAAAAAAHAAMAVAVARSPSSTLTAAAGQKRNHTSTTDKFTEATERLAAFERIVARTPLPPISQPADRREVLADQALVRDSLKVDSLLDPAFHATRKALHDTVLALTVVTLSHNGGYAKLVGVCVDIHLQQVPL